MVNRKKPATAKNKSIPPKVSAPKRKSSSRSVKAKAQPSQKVIVTVLVLSCLCVVGALVAALVFNTEYEVKSRLSRLSQQYYEEYFYPNAFSGNINMAEALGQYKDHGLPSVNLRQMLLSVPGVTEGEAKLLREYCDEEATSMRFYPQEPYDAKGYRVEYTYSCNF